MMSGTSAIVKDVIGSRGAVSLVMGDNADPADIESHTQAGQLKLRVLQGPEGGDDYTDAWRPVGDGLGHQALCDREQVFLAHAIHTDLDLTQHHQDAVRSLNIVLAAERSMKERRAVDV